MHLGKLLQPDLASGAPVQDIIQPLFRSSIEEGLVYRARVAGFPLQLAALFVVAVSSVAALGIERHFSWAPVLHAAFTLTVLTALGMGLAKTAKCQSQILDELHRSRTFITHLLNGSSPGDSGWLWSTDCDGRLTNASPLLFDMLGLPPSDVIGRTLEDVMTSGNARGWTEIAAAMRCHRTIQQSGLELSYPHPGAWWSMSAAPVFDREGRFEGYVGLAANITGRITSYQRLESDKVEAQRASAAKSQLLLLLSHELRAPLHSIIGFTEILASNPSGEDETAERCGILLESSRHLQRLINDVLDLGRCESGTLSLLEQEADVAELVEMAVKMCRPAAERADAMVIAHVIDGMGISCDITRLIRAITTLVETALNASPKGGMVQLDLESQQDGGIEICIQDQGVRAAPTATENACSGPGQIEGEGLALALARRIALLHGGGVTIESIAGRGTATRLVVPSHRVIGPGTATEDQSRAA